MTPDGFEFEAALREARDYAAARCSACGTGAMRCATHGDTSFHLDFVERLGELITEQVHEVVRDVQRFDNNVIEDIEDMIVRTIPKGASAIPVADVLDLKRRIASYLEGR